MIAGGIGLVLILFVRKVNGSTGFSEDATVWNNLSITLNSYLNGPFNLSVVFAMREQYHPLTAITETLAELPAGGKAFFKIQGRFRTRFKSEAIVFPGKQNM